MLTLKNITRRFGDQPVLRGIDLDVAEGEIVCLLGPSGCGKTTLLRIVAGLESADSGDVLLDGASILASAGAYARFRLDVPGFRAVPAPERPAKRRVRLAHEGDGQPARQRRAREVLELVGLSGFERRDVAQLSGGERQRVALARSLAPNPRLLMLDEPLGSLDAALRERLVVDLRAIIKRVGLTALYVTHDQHEAFAIADRIALMNAGQIEQVGTPSEVYRRPATIFAARFLGLNNVVPVESVSGSPRADAARRLRLRLEQRATRRAAAAPRRHRAGRERRNQRNGHARRFSRRRLSRRIADRRRYSADVQARRPRSSAAASPATTMPRQHRAGVRIAAEKMIEPPRCQKNSLRSTAS